MINMQCLGVAVLSMNKKPVNSMNLEFMVEMSNIIQRLEAERKVEGLIITSVS